MTTPTTTLRVRSTVHTLRTKYAGAVRRAADSWSTTCSKYRPYFVHEVLARRVPPPRTFGPTRLHDVPPMLCAQSTRSRCVAADALCTKYCPCFATTSPRTLRAPVPLKLRARSTADDCPRSTADDCPEVPLTIVHEVPLKLRARSPGDDCPRSTAEASCTNGLTSRAKIWSCARAFRARSADEHRAYTLALVRERYAGRHAASGTRRKGRCAAGSRSPTLDSKRVGAYASPGRVRCSSMPRIRAEKPEPISLLQM